jgi:hypothetical protein
MSLRHSSFFERVQKAVPASFAIGFQRSDRIAELGANFIGESVRYGFLKSFVISNSEPSLTERKLNVPSLLFTGNMGTNDLPVGEVKRSSEIAKDIAANNGQFIRDGFILFGERGALAGLCICLKDVSERALFLKKFVRLGDVYRRIIEF